MPAKPEGVYADGRGGWYLKLTVGTDPVTGRRQQITQQITKRGFRPRRSPGGCAGSCSVRWIRGQLRVSDATMTVDVLLDGLDADGRLSAKTRYDYRRAATDYIRPRLGSKKVSDVTPQAIVAWQRGLLSAGGTKTATPLSANTVRLARAPLSGAMKLAVSTGVVALNPLPAAPRPRQQGKIPRHWTPEEARRFLSLMEGDRTWCVWAFLMGSGLRIGELVCLRWASVDIPGAAVRIVDFVSTLDHEVTTSSGKSRDAVRTIDLDDGLADVLRRQRSLQLTFQTDQSMGALAGRLVVRRLVRRLSGPGRAVRHDLTEKGTALHQEGARVLEGVLAVSFDPLTRAELATFDRFLQRLVRT